jgi:glycogen debranching enzyme
VRPFFYVIYSSLCLFEGYSPANSPHLSPALELDSAIIEFSDSLTARGLPAQITSEADLAVLIDAFNNVVKDLELWQFYVLNVQQERDSVRTALRSGTYQTWSGPNVNGKSVVELAEIVKVQGKITGLGDLASRFGVYVDADVAASLVKAAFVDVEDIDALVDTWIRVVDVINVPLYRECEEDVKVAVDNVRNRVKYTRLDDHGPKLGKINKE